MNAYEAYMNELSKQMREELTTHGFNSLESADAVTNYMQQVNAEDTTFVVLQALHDQQQLLLLNKTTKYLIIK